MDHRLLDRFFNALNMDAVLAAVHDIHRSMADRAMNQRQIEISAGMNQAMKQSAAIQAKLNWLQILVVGGYIVEFLTLLMASFPSYIHDQEPGFRRWSPLIVLVMSLVAALAAYFYLSSARRSAAQSDRSSRVKDLVFALFVLSLPVLFYAFGAWRQWISARNTANSLTARRPRMSASILRQVITQRAIRPDSTAVDRYLLSITSEFNDVGAQFSPRPYCSSPRWQPPLNQRPLVGLAAQTSSSAWPTIGAGRTRRSMAIG